MSRGPQRIGDILSELLARRGFGRVQSTAQYEAAWREVAGEMAAQFTRVGSLRRGALEIIVANSTLMQEFTFQKATLLRAVQQALPDQGIKDLRFRVGAIR